MLSSVRGGAPHPFDVVRDNELLAVVVMPLLCVWQCPSAPGTHPLYPAGG